MNIPLIIIAILSLAIFLLEIALRFIFGFGNPLLYIADDQIGYLLAPNQKSRRYRNQIEINEYSMRSATCQLNRPDGMLRILLLGDSIANGGWWTDQNQTISQHIAHQLLPNLNKKSYLIYKEIEVLNASANSWGPRNELAYLQKFGDFNAQIIVLLINTDDLFAPRPTSLPVGRDRNYPNRKPPFALVELFTRYILPAPFLPELTGKNSEEGDRVTNNLKAIYQIQEIVKQKQHKFILALTPLLRETCKNGPRDYEIQTRDRLKEFAETEKIIYLDFLPIFQATNQPERIYRDQIHLNAEGNQLVSKKISDRIQEILDIPT